MKKNILIQEEDSLKELTIEELNTINGGSMSEVGHWIVKGLGMMFMNAGAMACDGAAGHEIMGFK
jgi:bacteriocin-like protein